LNSPADHPPRSVSSGLRLARAVVSLVCGLLAPLARADTPASAALANSVLEQFRQSIWAEPVYAEFDLIQMPRRGAETSVRGRFWGARTAAGPVSRVELDLGKGGFTHRFLLQGGAEGGLWTSDGLGPGLPADDKVLTPVVEGSEVTPMELVPMPYLYWLDHELSGSTRIRGRPTYIFKFTPPGDFSAHHAGVASIRAYLDTQYDALVQSEVVGSDGKVSKTLSLLELRKAGDRWLPKDVDVRDEATRDKTRISLTGVAVGLPMDPEGFDPANLGKPMAVPSASLVKRL